MKKNLIILLFIPFLIALLGVVTINTTFQIVDNDIVGISWNYKDLEVFENNTKYTLYAYGINEKNYPSGSGNNLVWNVKNKDSKDLNTYATITSNNGIYTLNTINPGEVIVTCSNEKGTVFKSFNLVIRDKDTSILSLSDVNKPSQTNIDTVSYVGEYDLVNHIKEKAVINLNIYETPTNNGRILQIEEISDNILFDIEKNQIKILDSGDAFLKLTSTNGTYKTVGIRYNFKIVKDGVNVYNYNDLLDCTNKSENGEIVVLRKNFESLSNINNNKETTTLFGNYNEETNSFNFQNEVYYKNTTYNSEYIKQWNNYIKNNNGQNYVTENIVIGLRVQKDFYGNGYSINLHNLTYPSKETEVVIDNQNLKIPVLDKTDLFRGPLPFYALGDHNNMPLVEAFGQDNVGMYIEGDNITINDLNIRNCDFGNIVSNLNTVGTVVEIDGDNITIKNSILKNGKNIIRCFSSNNVLIENSLISTSRNFLVTLGSNEYINVDDTQEFNFNTLDGTLQMPIKDFLKKGGMGDDILNTYMLGKYQDVSKMNNALHSIQNALNRKELVEDLYKGSVEIKDTLFYQSGIASIAFETMFNGPFLYNALPSMVDDILKLFQTNDGTSFSELQFKNISGISYPVKLKLSGNTKFYDYKINKNLDISGLIQENISNFAASIKPDYQGVINIDKIFPIKVYLMEEARKKDLLYLNSYINIPIAYYGGGLNLSTLDISNLNNKEHLSDTITIDFIDAYLDIEQTTDTIGMLKNMMLKAVTVVTGTEPFKFICYKADGYLFNETPQVTELIEKAKGDYS